MSIDNNVFVDYGRRIGRKQGKKEQIIMTIDRMLIDHCSVDLIAKYADVSKQFVYQYMQKKNIIKENH